MARPKKVTSPESVDGFAFELNSLVPVEAQFTDWSSKAGRKLSADTAAVIEWVERSYVSESAHHVTVSRELGERVVKALRRAAAAKGYGLNVQVEEQEHETVIQYFAGEKRRRASRKTAA